jgi:HemX protein
MTPQLLLLLATLAFAGGMVHAILAVRGGSWRRNRWQWIPMLAGFLLQTAFLHQRGQEVGQCPMKSLSDILVFVSWSMVLIYFLVGSTYRLSLLGLFTAPLVTLLHALAWALPESFPPYPERGRILVLVELHAAVALVAYACFAMAAVTGVMYLVQERLLKRHHISGWFFQLPPIQELGRVIFRLVLLGWGLMTIALGVSFALESGAPGAKLILAWAVWGLYAGIALLMWRHLMSPRRMALLAVAGFAVPFLSLWLVS